RPGTVLDDLRRDALRHGLTFGPDPATHGWCTGGGMIGNNSCGVHSMTAGRTADNVEELEILTYDGLRLRVGATPEPEIDRIVRAGGGGPPGPGDRPPRPLGRPAGRDLSPPARAAGPLRRPDPRAISPHPPP